MPAVVLRQRRERDLPEHHLDWVALQRDELRDPGLWLQESLLEHRPDELRRELARLGVLRQHQLEDRVDMRAYGGCDELRMDECARARVCVCVCVDGCDVRCAWRDDGLVGE